MATVAPVPEGFDAWSWLPDPIENFLEGATRDPLALGGAVAAPRSILDDVARSTRGWLGFSDDAARAAAAADDAARAARPPPPYDPHAARGARTSLPDPAPPRIPIGTGRALAGAGAGVGAIVLADAVGDFIPDAAPPLIDTNGDGIPDSPPPPAKPGPVLQTVGTSILGVAAIAAIAYVVVKSRRGSSS